MNEEGYEMQYIKEAFDTNWIAPLGKNVNEFENEFADKIGIKSAAALSSRTAAIHLALKGSGVGEGISEKIFSNGVCLPSDTKMSGKDLSRIVDIIKGLWK